MLCSAQAVFPGAVLAAPSDAGGLSFYTSPAALCPLCSRAIVCRDTVVLHRLRESHRLFSLLSFFLPGWMGMKFHILQVTSWYWNWEWIGSFEKWSQMVSWSITPWSVPPVAILGTPVDLPHSAFLRVLCFCLGFKILFLIPLPSERLLLRFLKCSV